MLAANPGVVMNVELHRADPRLRRLTLVVMGIGLLIAVLSISMFHRWLGRSVQDMPAAQFFMDIRRTIAFAIAGCALCLLLLAGYAARLGRRVIGERRWPLRGARVVRDTPVRAGADALIFGRSLNVAAIVLIALAVGCGVLSWRLLGAA
jgi:hypothetical protein